MFSFGIIAENFEVFENEMNILLSRPADRGLFCSTKVVGHVGISNATNCLKVLLYTSYCKCIGFCN